MSMRNRSAPGMLLASLSVNSSPRIRIHNRRLARSLLGMDRGAILFAGAQIVFIKRFRIVQSARLERLGQATVNLAALVLRQQRGQRFADTLVVKLDSISRAAAAHQLRG